MKKIKVKIRSGIIGYVLGAVAAAALFMSGCGQKEEVEAPVVEQLDEDGNVIGTAETIPEEKDYLKYMSDDEIKSLASEALDAAGKDTGIADGSIMTFGINYDLPEGFEADPEKENLYVTDRYPIDASNVHYIELDTDYTLQLMSEESFKKFLEEAYLENYGETVDVDVTEFTETEIDGVPAFRIKAEYDLEDVHLEHLIIMINGSKTYIVDYTQTNEYDRMDLFEASAETISVRK